MDTYTIKCKERFYVIRFLTTGEFVYVRKCNDDIIGVEYDGFVSTAYGFETKEEANDAVRQIMENFTPDPEEYSRPIEFEVINVTQECTTKYTY